MIRHAGACSGPPPSWPYRWRGRPEPPQGRRDGHRGRRRPRTSAGWSRARASSHDAPRRASSRSSTRRSSSSKADCSSRSSLALAARPALNEGDWDGHVMLGLQVAGRAPSRRLTADGIEKRRRRRGGGRGFTRMARARADVRAGGRRRRGAGSADHVVHEVVEEVAQVHLEGLVVRLRVGADVDAVGVHEDDAEDGGEEAEGRGTSASGSALPWRAPAGASFCAGRSAAAPWRRCCRSPGTCAACSRPTHSAAGACLGASCRVSSRRCEPRRRAGGRARRSGGGC